MPRKGRRSITAKVMQHLDSCKPYPEEEPLPPVPQFPEVLPPPLTIKPKAPGKHTQETWHTQEWPLKNPKRRGGRKPVYTDDDIRSCIEDRNYSVRQTALHLGCSILTVYRRLRNMPKRPTPIRHVQARYRAQDVLKAFKGRKTLRELAIEYNLSIPGIKNNLDRAIRILYSPAVRNTPIFAKPVDSTEMKLLATLMDDEKLFDDAALLADETGVSLVAVKSYLDRSFSWISERARHGAPKLVKDNNCD